MKVIVYEGKMPEKLEALTAKGTWPYKDVSVEFIPCNTEELLITHLNGLVAQEAQRKDRLFPFPTAGGTYLLSVSKLLLFRSDGHRVYARFADGRELMSNTLRKSAHNMLVPLTESDHFEWVTQSLCVNKAYIEQITSKTVLLKNGAHLPISRSRYSALRKKYRVEMDGAHCHERS